jgi:hypothetical protein
MVSTCFTSAAAAAQAPPSPPPAPSWKIADLVALLVDALKTVPGAISRGRLCGQGTEDQDFPPIQQNSQINGCYAIR